MADVSSTLKLESGKRYRWVVEGSWNDTDRTFGQLLHVKIFPHEVVSIEPLPDPEPAWRHGAVVKVPEYSFYPFIYDSLSGYWRTPSNGYGNEAYNAVISKAYEDGTLEIIYTPEG